MKMKRAAGIVVATLLMAGSQLIMASGDNDDDDRGGYRNGSERSERYSDSDDNRGSSMRGSRGRDVAAVDNQMYAKECGSCHFAYQPGLLPERSWRKLMESLNDHFGENAELADADRQALTDYMVQNAADHSNYKRSLEMDRSIARGDMPLRISKVPYFVKEHREVTRKIKGSDKIKSMSQCELCHQRAIDGSYAEREINVPGFGRWED